MNKKILLLIALIGGLAATRARAQVGTPLLVCYVNEIDVTDNTVGFVTIDTGGSNYGGVAPTVVFKGGGGELAFGTAVLDPSGNAVIGVNFSTTTPWPYPHYISPAQVGPPVVASVDYNGVSAYNSGGFNYVTPPSVTFVGGGAAGSTTAPTQATGRAGLNATATFIQPNQNESYGPAGDTLVLWSVALGTDPESGFTFDLTVNGKSIGQTTPAVADGQQAGGYWTPALPGVYSIVTSTSDGNGNTAVSLPIRYFAFGTVIVAPVAGGVSGNTNNIAGNGTLVPVGSSVIIQANSTGAPTATPAVDGGFVKQISFYTDWTGSTATSTLIGTATNYPYSVTYTPTGVPGTTHLIKAYAIDNTGAYIPAPVSGLNPNQDEILLTVTTANPGGLPTGTIFAPLTGSLLEIPDYSASAGAYIPVVVEAGAQAGAQIARVEFYINGVLNGTLTAPPYNFKWSPQSTGQYALTALIYDSLGNVAQSASFTGQGTTVIGPDDVTIEAAPAIAITSPGGGATITTGGATVQAVAVDTNLDSSGNPIPITQVQFYMDGNFVGAASAPVSGDLYQVSFKPIQNTSNGTVLPSVLTAIATDKEGFQGTSSAVTVTVTAGGGATNNVVIGTPPTVTLTSPGNNATAVVNNPTTLTASATAPNGNIASVSFLVDNVVLQTIAKYPYSVIWTPANLGSYQLSVQVTDNVGDKTTSSITNVTVVAPTGPSVNFTSPAAGSTVSSGSSVTLTANAASPSGTIAQVQFFENGISIGTVTSAPYTISFTPPSSGVYTLTAIATDNSGIQTTSSPIVVEAIPSASGVGTAEFFGQYQGLSDGGRFAFITIDGKFGTYIGHSVTTNGSAETPVLYTDIAVSSTGNFTTKNLTGSASAGGVNGTLTPSQDIFIGAPVATGGASAGYYTGSITGSSGSTVIAIVGGDGSMMAYIANGAATDVADGSVDSDGNFTITTIGNNTLSGSLSLTNGFLTGTLTGAGGGSITAAKVSGGTFSDGVLKNISTRGQVGTGNNIMIAGFVVGGSASKQLLVRAVGPTLSTFGLSGAIPSTVLQVFSGTTLVQQNTGWSSTTAAASAITAADSLVGAFALPSGSADSALIGTFAPGSYTVQISGVSGATGLALAEVYDMDAYTPFSANRLINVSTRGDVGTGTAVLIGGFNIDGTAPKRLLIRGVGPTLSSLSVSGALSAAHLQLMDTSGNLIRENYSWGTGNDAGLVSAAATATGAFALKSGSADASILIVLPPGTYTAILSGASGATGVGMVEVYEVP
jgi:hypothetical protein